MINSPKRFFYILLACISLCLSSAGIAQKLNQVDYPVNGLGFSDTWKYHEGDNHAWASSSFDDKSWDTVQLSNWNGYSTDFKGSCWFRKTLKVPHEMFHRTLLLLVNQAGASEVYFDNKLIKTFGKIGDLNSEVPYDPQNEIHYIELDTCAKQVIAVRFSSNKILKKGFSYAEFHLSFAPLEVTNTVTAMNEYGSGFTLVTFGIFFTIAIFHFLLFIYYRKVLSNLFYSILALLLSCFLLYPVLIRSTHNPINYAIINQVESYIYAPCFFLIVLLLYSIFGWKRSWFFWVMVALTVFTEISISIGGRTYFTSIVTLGITTSIGSLVNVFKAVRDKKPGARILAWGFAIFLTLILFIFISSIITGHINTDFSGRLAQTVMLVWIFSIPMSMSVYLASDFARTNKRLEKELVHVKQLGEQNVQKEIEKQEIIKGQKQALEIKVFEATAEIRQQKDELAEKNREITDSINYARRIQTAILPEDKEMKNALGDYLTVYKPKDVVSGDFYWCHAIDDKVIFTVADCTGHGVPGAFMSMIGNSLLNEIVLGNGVTEANTILDDLRRKLIETLQQNAQQSSTRDGMDIALCVWNRKDNVLQFAGANNSLYLVSKNIAVNGSVKESDKVKLSNDHLLEILPDKQPIGFQEDRMNNTFTKNIIQLNKGDTIYISSDGFTDQFGGEKSKKFTSRKFRALLASLADKTISEQKTILEQTFEEWKRTESQTDDICVLGVKI